LRLTPPLQRTLVDYATGWALDDGIELTRFFYQHTSWSKARRMIGIRQHIAEREHAGKSY